MHTASPFNIKVESLSMRDFNADEVAALYAQHTAETGQGIATDRARSVTGADIDRARDLLVERQDT